MDFLPIFENIHFYTQGLWTTLQLVALVLPIGLVLAIGIALLRVSKNPAISALPWAFIYFFTGTPLLVQLFLVYYGFGQFEFIRESFLWPILREAWWCVLITFILNTAAYTAEILRGAIQETSFGEIEAARAYGMSKSTIYRRIILPSAFRRSLPAYGNEVIFTLHGSVLAGVVTLIDLFGATRVIVSRFFIPFEAYTFVALYFMILTFMIVYGFKLWEGRWHAHLRPRKTEIERPSVMRMITGTVLLR